MKADSQGYNWESFLIAPFSGRSEASWQKLWSTIALFSALPKPSLFFNSLSSLFNFVRMAVFIWLRSTLNLAATWSGGRSTGKFSSALSQIHKQQASAKEVCLLKIQWYFLTNYASQDLRWQLRLVAFVSSKGVPAALQRVRGQRFSVKKYHQQCWCVLLVVCNLCNALVKIFRHSKSLREIWEVVIVLRAKKKKEIKAESDTITWIKLSSTGEPDQTLVTGALT